MKLDQNHQHCIFLIFTKITDKQIQNGTSKI